MTASNLLLVATLLPLASFVLLIFFGKRLGRASAFVATAAILAALALSVTALVMWYSKATGGTPRLEANSWTWIPIPASPGTPAVAPDATVPQGITVGIVVDSLTLVMFLLVNTVALLVHVFSIAYMAGDAKYSRFFAYLGLFCFSMLGLLLSNNLLQLFIFWELVGICSYLLIGFWYEKRGPAFASRKAVITNRVGDIAFVIGIGILVTYVGVQGLTLFNAQGTSILAQHVELAARAQAAADATTITQKFADLAVPYHAHLTDNVGASFLGISWLTWAGLLLFGGAVAKSAQFPLHVWLPDAMEGPTPVSALIHAATMVAAGVYLVARLFPVLTLDVRLVIAIIGCTTLLMGALVAIVQTDLKRVLAYSTISQLGFMMLFLGCGGYTAGMFHLVTHGFFKACLFLSAGSVIHAMHHEQDMRQMGGLWRKIPVTALTFLIAVLAIAGTPYFSGYYSKELGLAAVYEYAQTLPKPYGMLLFWVPAVSAYITAFYMMRAWVLTFLGSPRNEEKFEHAHESPTMTLPLLVLASLSIFSAAFGLLEMIIRASAPSQTALPYSLYTEGQFLLSHHHFEEVEHAVGAIMKLAWVAGPLIAVALYFGGFKIEDFVRRLPGINLIHSWLYQRMFFDYLYEGFAVGTVKVIVWISGMVDKYIIDFAVNLSAHLTRLAAFISGAFDSDVVDGAVNGAAEMAQAGGRAVLAPQTGRIRFYVLSMLTVVGVAAVALAAMLMLRS